MRLRRGLGGCSDARGHDARGSTDAKAIRALGKVQSFARAALRFSMTSRFVTVVAARRHSAANGASPTCELAATTGRNSALRVRLYSTFGGTTPYLSLDETGLGERLQLAAQDARRDLFRPDAPRGDRYGISL